MRRPGRPKKTRISRAEQLRRSQRKGRQRDRAAGLVTVQLKLPDASAAKLKAAARDANFLQQLDEFLADSVVRVGDYPVLSEIAWNRSEPMISARDAFGLYERNWRFVTPGRLNDAERALLKRLSERFGAGLIHA